MQKSLRIAVADDEADVREYFQKILPRLGHRVVAIASDGQELVELCRSQQPDLVLTDIRMPNKDGIQAAIEIYEERPVPVILVSAYHDSDLVERAEADHVMGYLVKPIRQSDLQPAIAIALSRFEEFEALRQEIQDLQSAIQARRTIEQAKGVLMKQEQCEEGEAFRRLQKMADDGNRSLIEQARQILNGDQQLHNRKS